jgi:hypothetical protein
MGAASELIHSLASPFPSIPVLYLPAFPPSLSLTLNQVHVQL